MNKNEQNVFLIDWSSTTHKEQAAFAENYAKWQTLTLLYLNATSASKNRLIMLIALAGTVLLLTLFGVSLESTVIVACGLHLFLFGASHIFEHRVRTTMIAAETVCHEHTKTLAKKYPVV